MQLALNVYEATRDFPAEERFGLVSQMRRAAVSIPSNIAEGAGRDGRKEFAHFLGMARGSLSELETQCMLAYRLGFLRDQQLVSEQISRTFRLIGGLQNKLRNDQKQKA
ncbi:four helix bundle protein [Guyparkeria hydrothermalis]|uniref:four helix bundle protein n=1 Tax=Guyparkeria hydrothermalis TaxID=923 RepID=UPI0020228CF0|nr:four helix bundle protein [Guyparkeria hydrothermalis]MCL7743676.1 four helix bundle protein [Guyparkeria hydrothermalis]